MKIIILQENLFSVLKEASLFIPSSPPISILENFLLVAEKNTIKVLASSLSCGIQKTTRAKVEKEGKICINAKAFFSFINQLSPGKTEIFLDKKQLIVRTDNARAAFNSMAADEFPSLEEGRERQKIEKEELVKIARLVAFAAATEETRAVLMGVVFGEKEERGMVVATDGFRLSLLTTEKPTLGSSKEEVIVPARLFIDLTKIIPGTEEVFIGKGKEKGKLIFSWKDTLINVQLIEGKFPDFERIIPQHFSARAVLEKDKFEHLVRTSAVFASASANIVRLTIKKEEIEISASSPQIGSNKGRATAQTEGEEQKIAFNSGFLLDFLKSADGAEEIIFETSGSLKPGVFKIKKEPGYLHIIMPVRVQEET